MLPAFRHYCPSTRRSIELSIPKYALGTVYTSVSPPLEGKWAWAFAHVGTGGQVGMDLLALHDLHLLLLVGNLLGRGAACLLFLGDVGAACALR